MRPLSPPWIDAIAPYVPGKPIEEVERELGIRAPAKLASNENCLGPSPKALEAARAELDRVHLYPEGGCHPLRDLLAARIGCPRENFIFGNGSHNVLEMCVRAFVAPDEEVMSANITFVVYRLAAQSSGRTFVEVPVKDMRFDLPAMARAITPRTKLIYIANPNNPTGTVVDRAELSAFLRDVPKDVVVVLDEAYIEYVRAADFPDSLSFHGDGRRILTTRTFSKIYGLAGLRVGYGIAEPPLIAALEKVREAFNVNRVAQAAACAALSDQAHLEATRRITLAGLETVTRGLAKLGVAQWESQTNFVFVDFKRDAKAVCDALLHEGLIIRPIAGPYARITIGTVAENERLLAALSKVLRAPA